jgi:cobalt/nickel transport system permease protein
MFRLIAPFGVAGVVLFTQIFFYGGTPFFEWNLFGLRLVGYEEGLSRGFLIMWKVVGAVSSVLFLSMTTPADKMFSAASWFRVPRTWIEIALLTYRYIFVLLEDAITVKDAQKVRLGYCNWRRSLRSLGTLAGAIIVRAYDQSLSTYQAMWLRGYSGRMMTSYQEKFKFQDKVEALVLALVLLLLLILGLYWK